MARKSKTKTLELPNYRRVYKLWADIPDEGWLGLLHELAPSSNFQPKGRHIKGLCIVHNDTHPSMEVTPSKGIVKCHACGWCRLDPIAFVAALRHESYVDSAQFLRKRFNLRGILSDEVIDQLEADEAAANVRSNLITFACSKLYEAIQLYRGDGVEQELSNVGLRWATPAVEFLISRRIGEPAPHERVERSGPTADPWEIWHVLCNDQLVGVSLPIAIVDNHFGEKSDEAKASYSVFGAEAMTQYIGWPIFPHHRLDGRPGRIKVRNLAAQTDDDPKYFVASDPTGDGDERLGFYGARAHRIFMSGGGLQDVSVVEGETGALQIIGQQTRRDDPSDVVLALGGGASPSIDPLAAIGVARVRIIGDRDNGGASFVKRVAEKCTEDLSLRIYEWTDDSAQLGIKDPDQAVLAWGYNRWVGETCSAAHFMPLASWCVEQAKKATTNGDDPAQKGRTAETWGSLLRDPQDRATYASDVATALGIDASVIGRALEAQADKAKIEIGDHVELARCVLRDLRGESEATLVHAEGATWRYDHDTGLWCQLDEDVLSRATMKYSGVIFGDGGIYMVKLKASDVSGIIKLAAHQAGYARFFDEAPIGIAFRNGFLMCKAKNVQLMKHSPDHRARVALPFEYVKRARAPRFERFLFQCLRETHCTQHRSHDGKKLSEQVCTEAAAIGAERHVCWPTDRIAPPTIRWKKEYEETLPLIRLIQEFVGISLLGRATKYAKSLVNTGPGANGKSVLLDVINALFPMGSYTSVEPQLWGKEYNRAQLAGARINLVPELPKSEILATSHYKGIITGDITSGRSPYGKPFTFRPIAGHLFLTNSLPAVTDHSRGFWRRQEVIEWRHKFNGKHAEVGLTDYIVANELPGVAAWAIAGAVRLIARERYDVPEASKKAVAEWQKGSNSVALWIADATTDNMGDNKTYVPAWSNVKTLHAAFGLWVDAYGYTRMNLESFRKRLRELEVEMKRGEKGMLYQLAPRPMSDAAGAEEMNNCRSSPDYRDGR